MPEKPKVLFIARWFPVKTDTMPGLFVVRHAKAVQHFVDVTVINVAAGQQQEDIYETEVKEEEGIPSIVVYYKKSKLPPVNFYRYAKSLFKAFKIYLNAFGLPDITHVHVLSRTAILALYLKKIYNIPYLITEHWSRYMPENVAKGSYSGRLRKTFTKYAVENAFAVTTVTEHLKNSMLRLGLQNNYIVIPNAIDTSRFIPANDETTAENIILHVSCFEESSKNIKGIIDAAEKLLLKRNDFELLLVGDGINKPEIENFAAGKNFPEGKIKFTGLLAGNELVKVMQRASVQVLFSNYESQPSVILESFSCGVPFIATSVGGIPEIINENNGVLVEKQNIIQLTDAMNYMLDNRSGYSKKELHQFASDNYSYEVVGKMFYDIYLQMMTEK